MIAASILDGGNRWPRFAWGLKAVYGLVVWLLQAWAEHGSAAGFDKPAAYALLYSSHRERGGCRSPCQRRINPGGEGI